MIVHVLNRVALQEPFADAAHQKHTNAAASSTVSLKDPE